MEREIFSVLFFIKRSKTLKKGKVPLRVKFYQIYQDLELEEKIVSARAIVNRYQGKDETFKTLYNVFKEYNDNLETRMKQIPNIQLKLTPIYFFLKYKKTSYNQFISFRFVLGL